MSKISSRFVTVMKQLSSSLSYAGLQFYALPLIQRAERTVDGLSLVLAQHQENTSTLPRPHPPPRRFSETYLSWNAT